MAMAGEGGSPNRSAMASRALDKKPGGGKREREERPISRPGVRKANVWMAPGARPRNGRAESEKAAHAARKAEKSGHRGGPAKGGGKPGFAGKRDGDRPSGPPRGNGRAAKGTAQGLTDAHCWRRVPRQAAGDAAQSTPFGRRPTAPAKRCSTCWRIALPNSEGARVLDLFAGTGALGMEALSRGAANCLFIEESAEGRGLIRDNVEAFGLQGRTKIFRRDATSLGDVGTILPFGLLFADPPYGKGLGEQALESAGLAAGCSRAHLRC